MSTHELTIPDEYETDSATAHQIVVTEATMWLDNAHWLPFIEHESADITGPGWQDPEVFAAMVNAYDRKCGWESETTANDVTHKYVVVAGKVEDESLRLYPVPEGTPGAVPVTTIWGQR